MNLKALILVAASGLVAFGAVSAHATERTPVQKQVKPVFTFPLFEGRNAAVDNSFRSQSFRAQAARNTDAAIRIETHYDRHSR